ncbi:tRNA (adenosine(37)-N6)-threonylcarbamoyltransferase complex ATPase subunit type 1 TsaE [Pectinatus haikarae]|uniref:tRNA threonylcarbamoyladenosine biosynthesis protein TsaE n=1 Tax=Pectinatus haikarae TaxID=349096 RepID=A0ABT9YAJ9_9FIRM|nr:tRNA (adenosine(37)-N6)-threonylcarbamoyltransferase complex ATPase subunit type 1 TsaE [Pectinatus haikarae]MDQ0204842.1 tRNA threonylcarbamoyladenosine biosynthesis protein TsaE [Pectinatus haikarae]
MEEKIFLLYTDNPAQTKRLGAFLGEAGRSGIVVCLEGELGAGKTTLTQGMAAFLHCNSASSPTFNLMNVYEGDVSIYHFDLYRLNSEDDLYEIGFYEYVQENGEIIIIEWPDRFSDALPEDNLYIRMCEQKDGRRKITVTLNGMKYQKQYEELKYLCQSLR